VAWFRPEVELYKIRRLALLMPVFLIFFHRIAVVANAKE